MDSVLVPSEVKSGRLSCPGKGEKGLSWRQMQVVQLALVMSPKKVAEATGYSYGNIHRILNKDEAIAVRQQIFALYDDQFANLYPKVIKAVQEGLESKDPKEKLDASKIWLKAHGRFQSKPQGGGDVNVTAEEVVVQILNQARDG